MKISLLLLIIGIIFIIFGYADQISPDKDTSKEIEFVPRDVYDQLSQSNII